jgi:hypothetical protein
MKLATVLLTLLLAAAPAAVPTAHAQATSELMQRVEANSVLSAVAEAGPPPAPFLRATIVRSSDFALHVAGGEVTITTTFLQDASRNALAAAVVQQLVPDAVHLAILLHRAGFDGPAGVAELHARYHHALALDAHYRTAATGARHTMTTTINDNSFWFFARPGFHLMYRATIDGAVHHYDRAAAAQQGFVPTRVFGLPPVPAELVAAVSEITTVLRGADHAGLSPWRPLIDEALARYEPPVATGVTHPARR